MDETTPANPQGAEPTPLYRTEDVAERLRGMLGSSATDEASADTGTEEVPAEVEQTEAEPTEPTETTEPDEVEEQPRGRYKVKVNDQELAVTFDELRNGYQRDADYRQKTMKLAEERKALEAERAHYAEQLKGFIPALQAQLQDEFANIDWTELAKSDPARCLQLQMEYQQKATRLNIARAEQERLETVQKQQREAEFKQRLSEEQAKLAKALPDYVHPEKGKAIRSDLRSHLMEIGYSSEEIAHLADHRAAIVAYESMQYRKAQKAKAEAAKQAKVVPQVQKPGTATKVDPNSAALSAAQERFSKTGRVEDLAAVLRARNRPS